MSFKLKKWFLEVTGTTNRRGTRLRIGDRPSQETFQNFLDSSVHKDVADRAKEDSTANVETLSGHVVAATNDQTKAYQDKKSDRTLVVQPNQTPETKDNGDQQINVQDTTYWENYQGKEVEVGLEPSDKRNIFVVGLFSAFKTWLTSGINSITSKLNTVDTATTTNTNAIAGILEVLGTVTGGLIDVTEITPVGTISAYGGSVDPNAKFLVCDGRSLNRTTYNDLFLIIGTAYGEGTVPGVDFAIPDLRGKSPKGTSTSLALGSTGGTDNLLLANDNIPLHQHDMGAAGADFKINSSGTHKHSFDPGTAVPGGSDLVYSIEAGNASPEPTPGVHEHEVSSFTGFSGRQGTYTQSEIDMNAPYQVTNFIIKVS